jgi:hypothetical protein
LSVGATLATLVCGGRTLAAEDARVVLERADRTGWWRATYRLAEEHELLRFQNPARFYRERVWKVVTRGWRIERRDDQQVLVGDTAASRVAVEFQVYTDHIPKAAELFREFTDGSVAIFTGHLYVATGLPPQEGTEATTTFVRCVELVARDDEHVVVQGDVRRGRTVWDDPHGEGSYVYFGTIDPLETDSLIAVIDPGAPSWLARELRRQLPRMLERYEEGFGETLPTRPVVLLDYSDGEEEWLDSGGGAFPGQLQMSAIGAGWRAATPEAREGLLQLIGHETSHLWNGVLHEFVAEADAWMHEGSAEAFAALLLHENQAIDAARLAEHRTQALNACAKGLGGGSLRGSAERGRFQNYYACGAVIAFWSMAAIGEPNDLTQLFRLWRSVFADAGASPYSAEDYFRALERLGVERSAVQRLRRLVTEALDEPTREVRGLFQIVSIDIATQDRTPREQAEAALQHLMRQSCKGHSYYREWPRLRTAALSRCPGFDRELRIVRIGGEDVDSSGHRAFAATIERCEAGLPVPLGLEDGTTVMAGCRVPPPPLPPNLVFPTI